MELNIAESFFLKANLRIQANFKAINRNDDDQLKFISAQIFEGGKYPFDIV
jgi:hypothetical protein